MNPDTYQNSAIDERVERLICRRLDGEITADEAAELDEALVRSAAARALLAEYAANDALAAAALRSEFERAMSAAAPGRRRGMWLAAAGTAVAAAAAIAFSVLFDNGAAPRGQPERRPFPIAERPGGDASMPGQFVDYRMIDDVPGRRETWTQRDVIGIRGDDENRIYILERNARSTRFVPKSRDF